MKQKRKFGFETRMLHAGHIPDSYAGARAVPIFQTSGYVFDSPDMAAQLFELKQYGNIYTRINNPTTAVFEERIASLENGTGAVATASGMAAQMITFMTLLQPGDEIVASSHLYGGTYTQFEHTFRKLSIKVHFVDISDIKNWEQAINSKTKALYGETIGNPAGSIFDFEGVSALAKAHGIPLIIDNTLATPYLCKPLDLGADIVVHSATKFINGHGNAIAGVIVDSGRFDFSNYPSLTTPSIPYHNLNFYETFGHYAFLMKTRVETLRDTGGCLSPFDAFLCINGLETLALRMERHVSNAQKVAEFLQQHPLVDFVNYPGLKNHPHHERAKKYLPKGPGALFAFAIKSKDGREAGRKFIENVQLFSHVANIGDCKSLVVHPASTTHQQLSNEEMIAAGINPGLIRLSVGLETIDDLLWDLEQALHATSL
ncbi:MAG TPA: O-acetylhomoserine aminocarboxypropyltransferase/cysteine synthase family protein [Cyclobacteriaceae bacterium]|nr:O-acetylhomoserine aminocarboxypropyltransferase/cysteine synthase family protein [Cyclobacteriaceae bacterium]